MDGMREEAWVGDVDPNGGVGAKVVNVPLGFSWVGVISCFGEEKDGLVVICSEGDTVHGPLLCQTRL